MTHDDIIREYYRCFRDRDRATLERILRPDFRHLSPFGAYDTRDRMLDEIWPHVGAVYAIDIEVFGERPGYMVRYRHSGGSPARLAEYVRFDGEQIAEIEVYLGRGAMPSAS